MCRGISPSSKPHILPPNICMPSSAKMNTVKITTKENSPRLIRVR